MAHFGKILGGGLGWVILGPIGALAGVFVGGMFDSKEPSKLAEEGRSSDSTSSGDFGISLIVLSAAVMKADGKVMKSELNFVKNFVSRQFGENAVLELMPILQNMLKESIPLREVCVQIRHNMQHPLRLQLLHYLYGIAASDGIVDQSEDDLIQKIAYYLGIQQRDVLSIREMFVYSRSSNGRTNEGTTIDPYKVLEIESNSSDQELKKAYRKMALKYHPDKLAQLGDEFQHGAKEKFQAVQDAYEMVKEERGIK